MLLREGETCLASARADRAALLVDMACYFDAAKSSMEKAEHSIHFLNWAFEQATFFHPGPNCGGDELDRIGPYLKDLAKRKPHLDIRILCWDSAMPVAATQRFFPFADRKAFAGTPVKFRLDNHLPLGACHHQKMIVIDDRLAYCGGGDIGPDRWDTPLHLDDDPRREKTRRDHKDYDSRHEVMGVVDGAAAQMLSRVFRDRWSRACGEQLTLDETKSSTADLWPGGVTPDFRNVLAGASRTQGRWKSYPSVREVEALHLRSIREAKRTIYMESQYFTSPLIAEALAARLRQAEGPEVLLVSTEHSPSYFDRATMDKTRWDFLSRLQEADRHDRFRAFSPVTTLGRTIIVHAKLSIIDDRLLRIGSANINNRSMGFDTECDLSFEGDEADAAFTQRLAELRTDLIAHWFGCRRQDVEGAVKQAGGRLIAGIETLRKDGRIRLRPIPTGKLSGLPAIIARNHLGDPVASEDAWRPWRRRSAASERLQTYHLNPEAWASPEKTEPIRRRSAGLSRLRE